MERKLEIPPPITEGYIVLTIYFIDTLDDHGSVAVVSDLRNGMSRVEVGGDWAQQV